ncbi:LysR family transcriptional regulator [Vineibacter terrae]|uniref:LysR family transcriptional regulator n=1 Tax=Vineibacter terrae TaxID=2586908 RepID=A0A5C8PEA6_9HYPH|nr:LysR family transcriptional regulator [Vineibacter terrae]TXL72128.1 LysR family transcriptional regulator [Vineibacter terrae]
MINLNTRCIQAFLAVADCGSFRRAAEILNRSQSAISAQIQQVEQEFSISLLNRTTRSVSLTDAGRRLAIRCRNIVADLDAVAQELREEVQIRRGRVTIGCSPSISTNRLPPIIAEFRSRYPGIAVSVKEDFAREMYERLRNGEVDFALGPRLEGLNDFAFEHILDDPLVAVLPPDFPLRRRRDVRFEDVMHLPQLSMPKATATRQVVDGLFHERGAVHSPAFEVTQQQTLFTMVEAGLGMTIMPLISVPRGRQRRFQVARLTRPKVNRDVSAVTQRGARLSPPSTTCLDLVISRLRAHDDELG